MHVTLDFGEFTVEADLFDTRIARGFYSGLPYRVELIGWGDELYGSIGADLGEEQPVADVPPGGLAYTNRGSYFCIFFGQTPAWPVEHIGAVRGGWEKLRTMSPRSVIVSAVQD